MSMGVVHSLSTGVCHLQPLFEMGMGVSVVCLLWGSGPCNVSNPPPSSFNFKDFEAIDSHLMLTAEKSYENIYCLPS